MTNRHPGKVYLVGAGPGDPRLLTLRGKECLSFADTVVYDYLANPALLDYANPEAEFIYVGKKGGSHSKSQQEINNIIIEGARQGRRVVRLKGGDPFVFGRGGEEAVELSKAGIDFDVVPGVSSAVAVPAYAGIPLTHRDYASAVTFVTGHEDPQKRESSIAWDKIASGAGTLVFLMGMGNLPMIVKKLVEQGQSPDSPVAVIRRGTLPEQNVLTGTLGTIADLVQEHDLRPPGIIVVGDVVRLRKWLNWYETKPLFSRRIVVTRARKQASDFLEALSLLGADCIEFPTIQVVPPESWAQLDKAIKDIGQYHWALFTSPNGVRFFLRRLMDLGKDVRDLKGLKIATIGPKTAEIWRSMGIEPDLIPGEYRAEGIVEALRDSSLSTMKILLPRASQAREVLPKELKKMGSQVDVVPAYRTIKPEHDARYVKKLLEEKAIDMVTFTSSSTVNNFVDMLGGDDTDLALWMKHVAVATIGPVTAESARAKGFTVDVVPSEYTIEALTESIINYFGGS